MRSAFRLFGIVLPLCAAFFSCGGSKSGGAASFPQTEPSPRQSPSPVPNPSPVPTGATTRPLQYVEIAFDAGSGNNAIWKDTLAFARSASGVGKPARFTYFASGAFFLTERTRMQYRGPGQSAGTSNVGFSASNDEVLDLVACVNESALTGHEIGSHAVGHFDGAGWTSADWRNELNQFFHLVLDVFATNALNPGQGDPTSIAVTRERMTGFRAPYLSVSSGLRPALRDLGFRYDTSRTDVSTVWPRKDVNGIWNFPLAQLKIAGTGKATLSMDYNFYVAQSGAVEDPVRSEIYRRQTLETYLRYFENNYNGGRAPLHIGHHLDLWNGSAYWNALKDFVSQVCGLPETRCVTYAELADVLDRTSASTLADYREGRFPRTPNPVHFRYELPAPYEGIILRIVLGDDGIPHANLEGGNSEWFLREGTRVSVDRSKEGYLRASATLRGVEILSETRAVTDGNLQEESIEERALKRLPLERSRF